MTVIESMKARGVIPRAALYARFSSDNQREESIDAQLRAMREYCQRNKVGRQGGYILLFLLPRSIYCNCRDDSPRDLSITIKLIAQYTRSEG